jgi:hypothetical protein
MIDVFWGINTQTGFVHRIQPMRGGIDEIDSGVPLNRFEELLIKYPEQIPYEAYMVCVNAHKGKGL